jgi:hypothetical protein
MVLNRKGAYVVDQKDLRLQHKAELRAAQTAVRPVDARPSPQANVAARPHSEQPSSELPTNRVAAVHQVRHALRHVL